MASLKNIKNNYELLTMQERFSLFQQAVYRRDENEISRIIAESPKRRLTAPDFCEMPEKVLRQDIVNLLSRLNHCRHFEYFIDAAVNSKDQDQSEMFGQSVRLSAYLYTIETDAWRIVCDDLGLDANNFREISALVCFPVKIMNRKDKFIRDCAFDKHEADKFFKQLNDDNYRVITIEEKIRFYRENIKS